MEALVIILFVALPFHGMFYLGVRLERQRLEYLVKLSLKIK